MGRDLVFKDVPEDIASYLMEKGFAEICERGADKKFRKFEKILVEFAEEKGSDILKESISSLIKVEPQQIKQITKQLMGAMSKKMVSSLTPQLSTILKQGKLLERYAKGIAALSWVNIGLNVANLCVNAAGFAIVNQKLNEVKEELNQMRATLNKLAASEDIKWLDQYERVISDYSYMLDCEKTGKPFSEEKLHDLSVNMYHTLDVLQKLFMQDAFNNNNALLDAIYALIPLFSQTLIRYDNVYYFSNKDHIRIGSKLPNDQSKWLNLFDSLYSDAFLDRIQDLCILEKRMSTREASQAVALSFYAVASAKQDVLDNEMILLGCRTKQDYELLEANMNQYAEESFMEEVMKETAAPEEMRAMMENVFDQYELEQNLAHA